MMSPGMGQFLLWAFAALAPNPVVSRHLAVLSAGEMVRFRQGGTRYHVAQEQGDKSVEGADGCPAIASDNSHLWLHPQVDEETVRSGAWTTKDGGVLVKYTLDLFAYSYETIYLHLDHELFAIITPRVNFDEVRISKNVTGLTVENCNREKTFELVELSKYEAYSYEIFDKDGNLLGYSRESNLGPDRLEFFDIKGEPLAISQSPAITNGTAAKVPLIFSNQKADRVAPYETEFIINKSSILGKPENRWLIMAAVTARALRNSMRAPNGKVVMPAAYRWFQLLSAIFLIISIIIFFSLLFCIYRCVYPLEIIEVQNVFLHQQGKLAGYGTTNLAARTPGSPFQKSTLRPSTSSPIRSTTSMMESQQRLQESRTYPERLQSAVRSYREDHSPQRVQQPTSQQPASYTPQQEQSAPPRLQTLVRNHQNE